jgi:hypothetical protein
MHGGDSGLHLAAVSRANTVGVHGSIIASPSCIRGLAAPCLRRGLIAFPFQMFTSASRRINLSGRTCHARPRSKFSNLNPLTVSRRSPTVTRLGDLSRGALRLILRTSSPGPGQKHRMSAERPASAPKAGVRPWVGCGGMLGVLSDSACCRPGETSKGSYEVTPGARESIGVPSLVATVACRSTVLLRHWAAEPDVESSRATMQS